MAAVVTKAVRSTRTNRIGKAKSTNVAKIILTNILTCIRRAAKVERIAAAKRRRRRCVLPEFRLAAADARRSIRVAVAEVTKNKNRADAAAAVTPADVAAVLAETS